MLDVWVPHNGTHWECLLLQSFSGAWLHDHQPRNKNIKPQQQMPFLSSHPYHLCIKRAAQQKVNNLFPSCSTFKRQETNVYIRSCRRVQLSHLWFPDLPTLGEQTMCSVVLHRIEVSKHLLCFVMSQALLGTTWPSPQAYLEGR